MKRNAVPVRDMHTGETWPTMQIAAPAMGASTQALSVATRQHRPCKGRFIVMDQVDAYCPCCKEKIAQAVENAKPRLSQQFAQA